MSDVSTGVVHVVHAVVVTTALLVVDVGRKAVDAVIRAAEAITATGIGSIVVVECAHGVVLVVVGRGHR